MNWTGATTTYSGQPLSMVLEKGQSDDDNYGIYVWNNGGQFCFEYKTESMAYRSHCATNVLTMNQDHSIAVVFSHADQTIKLYADGLLIKTVAETEKLRNNDFPLVIGQQNYPGYEFEFIGTLRDVTVLADSLTDADITLMHDVTNP